jgi:hypothetical protein
VRLYVRPWAILPLILLGLSLLPCLLLSQGTSKTSASVPAQSSVRLSEVPRIGDTVSVIYTIRPSESVTEMRVSFDKLVGVEVVSGDTIIHSSAKKNEEKTFAIHVKFVSSPVDLGIWTTGRAVTENGQSLPLRTGIRMKRLVIVDEETGQFGTQADYRAPRPEYQYDPMTGRLTGDIGPTQAQYNRRRIDDLKERDPTLTDWDALYVLHDLGVLFGRYGLSGEKAIEVALEARKLTADLGIEKGEAFEKAVSGRETRRLLRFGVIMAVMVVELILLVFIARKVPIRPRNGTAVR